MFVFGAGHKYLICPTVLAALTKALKRERPYEVIEELPAVQLLAAFARNLDVVLTHPAVGGGGKERGKEGKLHIKFGIYSRALKCSADAERRIYNMWKKKKQLRSF